MVDATRFHEILVFEYIAPVFGRSLEIEPSDHHQILTEGSQDIYEGFDRRYFDFNV